MYFVRGEVHKDSLLVLRYFYTVDPFIRDYYLLHFLFIDFDETNIPSALLEISSYHSLLLRRVFNIVKGKRIFEHRTVNTLCRTIGELMLGNDSVGVERGEVILEKSDTIDQCLMLTDRMH